MGLKVLSIAFNSLGPCTNEIMVAYVIGVLTCFLVFMALAAIIICVKRRRHQRLYEERYGFGDIEMQPLLI